MAHQPRQSHADSPRGVVHVGHVGASGYNGLGAQVLTIPPCLVRFNVGTQVKYTRGDVQSWPVILMESVKIASQQEERSNRNASRRPLFSSLASPAYGCGPNAVHYVILTARAYFQQKRMNASSRARVLTLDDPFTCVTTLGFTKHSSPPPSSA